MKLRWHPAGTDRSNAERSNDDGGGEGAEYVDGTPDAEAGTADETEASRTAWHRAHHWTPKS